MKDKLIKLGFNEWLTTLEVAPYPVMFWDIPKFLQLSYIQKWFREVYDIYVLTENNDLDNEIIWYFYVNKKGGENLLVNSIKFKSYEEALEIGLQEALKLI